MTIHFEAEANLRDVAEYVLPAVTTDGEVYGVPGLRNQANGSGTRFYRPGLAGQIVVPGISPDQIARIDSVKARWSGRPAPDAWTQDELAHVKRNRQIGAGLAIASAILRRVVLFSAAGASSIHSWRTHDPSFTVELVFHTPTREQAEALVQDITSPYLAPHLQVESFIWPPLWHGARSVRLSMPSTGQTVELRFLTASGQEEWPTRAALPSALTS